MLEFELFPVHPVELLPVLLQDFLVSVVLLIPEQLFEVPLADVPPLLMLRWEQTVSLAAQWLIDTLIDYAFARILLITRVIQVGGIVIMVRPP